MKTEVGQQIIHPTHPAIVAITVSQLFGEYSYDIPLISTLNERPFCIMYGENGAGKTTIMQLLVHILNPEMYDGHRSAIGEVPFQSFAVEMVGGTRVSANRAKAEAGEYVSTIRFPSGETLVYEWHPDRSRKNSNRAFDRERSYEAYCRGLASVGLGVHFLSDSRKVLSFSRKSHEGRQDLGDATFRLSSDVIRRFAAEAESAFRESLEAAQAAVRSFALAGTSRGYESANDIYKQIAQHVISEVDQADVPSEVRKQELISNLKALHERNLGYAISGLTPSLDAQALIDTVERAPEGRMPILDGVLTPYLAGIKARLDALYDAQRVASAFSELMTEFYHGKRVQMHVSKGVTITTDGGSKLKPEDLSSGEQQLLLLMCNAISARSNAAVFAIDEPEISLNIKWQRELISALLSILEGSNCQLLLASHSIELLAQYSDHVVVLRDSLND